MSSEEFKTQNEAESMAESVEQDTPEAAAEAAAEEMNAQENLAEAPSDQSAELIEEVAKYKDQLIRTQAEMENVRRRAEMDVEKAHKFALDKFAKDLLPVVDSLEKAIETAQGEDEALAGIRQGVEMTLSMFLSTLNRFNLEQLDPVGEPFDPQFHEAMSMVDAPNAEPNSVIAVMQKGYVLNGRLVRPAMVMVSKAQAGTRVDEQA